MRSGTRKVADSKPDVPSGSKDSDIIPMNYIGKHCIKIYDCFITKHFPHPFIPSNILKKPFRSVFWFCFGFPTCSFSEKIFLWTLKGNAIITEEEGDEDEESGAGLCEQVAVAAGSIGAFIYKNSYIFTNVVMMVRFQMIFYLYFNQPFNFS